MSRLAGLLSILFLMLALGTSPVVHAAEAFVCASSADYGDVVCHQDLQIHADGEADGSGSGDKTVPHHHGNCHGQFVNILDTAEFTPPPVIGAVRLDRAGRNGLLTTGPDPALRPPQA